MQSWTRQCHFKHQGQTTCSRQALSAVCGDTVRVMNTFLKITSDIRWRHAVLWQQSARHCGISKLHFLSQTLRATTWLWRVRFCGFSEGEFMAFLRVALSRQWTRLCGISDRNEIFFLVKCHVAYRGINELGIVTWLRLCGISNLDFVASISETVAPVNETQASSTESLWYHRASHCDLIDGASCIEHCGTVNKSCVQLRATRLGERETPLRSAAWPSWSSTICLPILVPTTWIFRSKRWEVHHLKIVLVSRH